MKQQMRNGPISVGPNRTLRPQTWRMGQMRKVPFGTGILLFILMALAFISSGSDSAVSAENVLTDAELMAIVGGDSCKDCGYSGERQDECYHVSYLDPCSTSQCIANYVIEDTCTPGDGTCDGVLDNNVVGWVQYVRQDSGCSTSYPYTWFTFAVTYYGHSCTTRTYRVRCIKPTNNCNGTLISSTYLVPGVVCQ